YQEMLKRPVMQNAESQEEFVSNPLNAFGLLRRLRQDWPKWLSYLQDDEMIREMEKQLQQPPSEKDLKLAIKGLLRIERFYDLEASHMAKGLILDKQYDAHLNPVDCMALGSHLLDLKEYSKSTHWLRTAMRNYQKPYAKLYGQVLGLKRKQLARALALAIARETDGNEKPTDKTMQEWQPMADKLLNEMVFKASSSNIKKLTDEYLAGDEELFIKNRARHKPKPTAMERGCRGLWPPAKPHRLTCSYSQDNAAFQRLAPLKVEVLNWQPRIVLFHQVLSDSDSRSLQNLSQYRTSRDLAKQSVKLFPLDDSRLHRRITHTLGVNSKDQSLHVLNYGLGGYLQKNSNSTCRGPQAKAKTSKAARKASDVPLGGATIFTRLQLLVQPQKGSALVWENRDNAYKPEKLTEHAVCPVVVGSRW
ncbi:hypothetical protein KR044_013060, partial [Drosophila immigrans]